MPCKLLDAHCEAPQIAPANAPVGPPRIPLTAPEAAAVAAFHQVQATFFFFFPPSINANSSTVNSLYII